MSVVGFDIGCEYSKIAVAHRKKIEVVPNDLTKLVTPTLTAFTGKERHFGNNAQTQWMRNPKNTISQMKRWLGRSATDPTLQQELKFWLQCESGTLSDGRFGINVNTSQGKLCLAPEQILCGFFDQLKKFTTKYLEGLKVTDCVIACPSYFDDAQRRALLTAARLAELKVLRLLEEPTAVALNYGILRNLPENETQRVVFVDVGYASTQVAVVDFVRGKLTVRYKSFNPCIGGRDWDRALYEKFRKEWQDKYHVDVDNLPKQKLKLLQACSKLKFLLTGNKDALWVLDCFHNDNDFKLFVTREEMDASVEQLKLYDGLTEPLIEALEATKEDKVKIHSCEIVGGPSRVPSINNKILETVQKYEPDIKTLSTTLNGDESVARGCALMCAMLSPNFRVKEFQVQDILTWPITISYPTEKQTEQKIISQLIMERGNPQPCTAKVMFNKTQNFIFKLQHPLEYKTKDSTLTINYPFETNLNIGEFNVQLLPLSENAVQAPKIKLLLDINKQGLLDWPKASLIEYVKREPKPEPPAKKEDASKTDNKNEENKDTKKEDGTTKKDEDNDTEMKNEENGNKNQEDKPDVASSSQQTEEATTEKKEENDKDNGQEKESEGKMEVDEDEDDGTKKDDDKTKKKSKKKITRDLIITGNFFNRLKATDFNQMFELEANFINIDRIVHETDEAKNDLENYIYALRDKIDGSHGDFLKSSDKESLSTQLTEMEDWIYNEGDSANKTQFLERLKQLKDIGDPMEYRYWENEHREQRVTNFKKLIYKYQQWVNTEDEKYAHIEEDKRKEVKKYADDADAWITNLLIKQDRLEKYEAPTMRCKDIDNKYRELYNQCQEIVNIPKPKPKPKEEEKKEDNEQNKDKEKENNTNQTNGDVKPENAQNTANQENTANADATNKEDDGDTKMEDKTEKSTQDENPGNDAKNDNTDGMELE